MKYFGAMLALLLILCGLPELADALRNDHVGASMGLIVFWFFGELCGLIYVVPKKDPFLLMNYGFNTLITGALLWMKVNY